MEINFYYWDAFDIAVFLLSIIGGFSLASVLKNWLSRFILSIAVVVIVILSLIKGYNQGLEDITYSLAYYITYNPSGIIGFFVGFALGLFLLRRKSGKFTK